MKDSMLEFKDAPMFSHVMHDKDLCKKVLEVILEVDIGDVEYTNTEQTFDTPDGSKGVRLDVFVRGLNKIFDIEMHICPSYCQETIVCRPLVRDTKGRLSYQLQHRLRAHLSSSLFFWKKSVAHAIHSHIRRYLRCGLHYDSSVSGLVRTAA